MGVRGCGGEGKVFGGGSVVKVMYLVVIVLWGNVFGDGSVVKVMYLVVVVWWRYNVFGGGSVVKV